MIISLIAFVVADFVVVVAKVALSLNSILFAYLTDKQIEI